MDMGQCERRRDNVYVCVYMCIHTSDNVFVSTRCRQAALHTLPRLPPSTNVNPQYFRNPSKKWENFTAFSRPSLKGFEEKPLNFSNWLSWGGTRLGCLTSPVFPVHGYALSMQTIRYSDLRIYLGYDLVCK